MFLKNQFVFLNKDVVIELEERIIQQKNEGEEWHV